MAPGCLTATPRTHSYSHAAMTLKRRPFLAAERHRLMCTVTVLWARRPARRIQGFRPEIAQYGCTLTTIQLVGSADALPRRPATILLRPFRFRRRLRSGSMHLRGLKISGEH